MKKNSEILDWVLNRQNYKYLNFIFRSMQVGVASVTVKKKVTLTFIIKRRPSIRLSALIYTQLRRKKNTTKRPRTVILLQISEKDWTFLATYHGDHLSQTPFP